MVDAEKIKVLHLEDDPALLMLAKKILMEKIPELEGRLELIQVKSVSGAIKELEKGDVDLYISDHSVEEGKGSEALEHIAKKVAADKNYPKPASVLYLSAEVSENKDNDPFYSEKELNKTIREVTTRTEIADLDFLPKPYERDDLIAKVVSMVERFEAQSQEQKTTVGNQATVTNNAEVVYTIPNRIAKEAGDLLASGEVPAEEMLHTDAGRRGGEVVGTYTQALSHRGTAPKQAPRVFIITDDNDLSSRVLSGLYKAEGYDVTAANNSEECRTAMNNGYDLVVFGGGKFDGQYGLAADLMVNSSQRGHVLANTPKLAYVGIDVDEARATLAESGLNPADIIAKPSGQRELLERSNAHVNHEGKGLTLIS